LSFLSITFEEEEIRVVLFRGRKIKRWERINISQGLVKEGKIVEPFELGFYLKESLRERKIKERKVIAGVPSTGSILHRIRIPKVKVKEAREIIKREAKRELPVPVEEGRLFPIPLPEEKGFLRFLLLFVRNEEVEKIMDVIRSAELSPKGLELKSFALARAMNMEDGIGIWGEKNLELVIVRRGLPRMIRGTYISGIEELISEVRRFIVFYNTTYKEDPLPEKTPIFIKGSMSREPGMEELLKMELGYPPAENNYPVNLPEDFDEKYFSLNIGLALSKI